MPDPDAIRTDDPPDHADAASAVRPAWAALAWALTTGLATAAAVWAVWAGQALPAAIAAAAAAMLAAAWLGQRRHRRLQLQLGATQARQQALFEMQAAQIETLRQRAHTDALTGLANRRHFLALLASQLAGLADAAVPQAGLLLLRLQDLQGLNQRQGHAAGDRALRAIAEALMAYPARIPGCVAGRLNGADFALLLPAPGLALETAAALCRAACLPLVAIDAQARLHAGAIELDRAVSAAQALAAADAALAQAEAARHLPVHAPPADLAVPHTGAGSAALPAGESTWQRRIRRALLQGRVALGAYPVRTPDGRQLHLDCPLRVQLQPGGAYEPAGRWLSQAMRSRLCTEVDEKAVALALAAIAADGVARCVNVAAQSVASAEFVAAVSRRLEQAPQAACRLWIDLPEALALDRPLLLREVARRWRPLGVMLGLEHAGEALARIPRLIDLGLDCVRIDSRFVNGITGDSAQAARQHLRGLVALVQAVGLQVSAEGVRSADDLEALWQLGFDAATGPALAAEPAAAAAVQAAQPLSA